MWRINRKRNNKYLSPSTSNVWRIKQKQNRKFLLQKYNHLFYFCLILHTLQCYNFKNHAEAEQQIPVPSTRCHIFLWLMVLGNMHLLFSFPLFLKFYYYNVWRINEQYNGTIYPWRQVPSLMVFGNSYLLFRFYLILKFLPLESHVEVEQYIPVAKYHHWWLALAEACGSHFLMFWHWKESNAVFSRTISKSGATSLCDACALVQLLACDQLQSFSNFQNFIWFQKFQN